MVSVKESVERIKGQFLDVFGSDVTDIRLEEIKESNSNEYLFSLTVYPKRQNMNLVPMLFYKVFHIYNP